MYITVNPGQLVLIARMPMPPSTNHTNRAAVRERKNYTIAEYLAGKKPYYPVVHKDKGAEAYKQEALWMLRCPCPPHWESWQEPLVVRALREDLELKLDLELWEVFRSDKSDADNRVKDLQDILASHLEIDDKRIANIAVHKLVRPKEEAHIVARLRIALPYNGELERVDDLLEQLANERVGRYDRSVEEAATRAVPTIAKTQAKRGS